MRFAGVELGHFARTQDEFARTEDQARLAREDVDRGSSAPHWASPPVGVWSRPPPVPRSSRASRPGWVLVSVCGLCLLPVSRLAGRR